MMHTARTIQTPYPYSAPPFIEQTHSARPRCWRSSGRAAAKAVAAAAEAAAAAISSDKSADSYQSILQMLL
jgi:hypothetical protein